MDFSREGLPAMHPAALLETCAECVAWGQLPDPGREILCAWRETIGAPFAHWAECFLQLPASAWASTIERDAAYTHPWHAFLAHLSPREQLIDFLQEMERFPDLRVLLPLPLEVELSESGRCSVLRSREHDAPQARDPRAGRAARGPSLLSLPLAESLAVVYYGYYCDPWHLVGSAFAASRLAPMRAASLESAIERIASEALAGPGLRSAVRTLALLDVRLGFAEVDWLEDIIGPAIELDPRVRRSVGLGIAAELRTTHRLLDAWLLKACERASGPSSYAMPRERGASSRIRRPGAECSF